MIRDSDQAKVANMYILTLMLAAMGPIQPAAGQELGCIVMRETPHPSERPSPLDSVSFVVAGGHVKVCYGRPSARGRTMLGGEAHPFGTIWRTGANEPTMIHTDVSLEVAGVAIEPGSYSLYTVLGEREWEIIVNRSITQWGVERGYTEEVRAEEVGRGRVPSEPNASHVETFTIRAEPVDANSVTLVLEWEHIRVAVPIKGR
ncbi:MAG TPA: DUF2911 domain-containing protein [Gemmatimonadales bacterium]